MFFGNCVSNGGGCGQCGAYGQILRVTTSFIGTESADCSRVLPKNDGQSSKDRKGLHSANRELCNVYDISKTTLQC